MNGIKDYLKLIRYFILVLLFFNVFKSYLILNIHIVPLIALCPLIAVIEITRYKVKKKNISLYYFSLALSLLVAAALRYLINDFITRIYLFSYVIEILFINGIIKQLFLASHFILYIIPVLLDARILNNNTERFTDIGTSLLVYFSTICILYLSHSVRIKREETDRLNGELKTSYIKLQDYSLKVEELSVAKERQRVAQELHDSLGHSLMALAMHLDFAEKIFDKDPVKAKEVIKKAKEISKKSTSDLRMAVNTLKEERTVEGLKNAITELIESFVILGNIKINFDMDKALEELNPDIKLCIYKTIRESLTNGLRHGKATAFDINITMNSNSAVLTIKDNGQGCDIIIKSNGLRGIEDRVSALGGRVDFTSRPDLGFLMKIIIPIYEETKQ